MTDLNHDAEIVHRESFVPILYVLKCKVSGSCHTYSSCSFVLDDKFSMHYVIIIIYGVQVLVSIIVNLF